MLRFVVLLLATVLLISVLRSIIGVIMHGFTELMKGPSEAQTARRPEVPEAGELKKDPICGTYVSTATALKKTSGAQTVYFCSQTCLDKWSKA